MRGPLSTDFEVEPGLTFGEWLRREIEAEVVIEQSGFFVEQVQRVAARLQPDRPEAEQFRVLVPWMWMPTAFTAPGQYVYFGRRLLERCRNDEAVAFVIGHEIAHHELGHLDYFRNRLARRIARLEVGQLAVLFFRMLQRRLYSVEFECAADLHALQLCVRAGYDAEKCIAFFDTMASIYLDWGDLDGVYGLDEASDRELSPDADLMTKARIWLWLRTRGYLPIQDRKAELERAHAVWAASGTDSV